MIQGFTLISYRRNRVGRRRYDDYDDGYSRQRSTRRRRERRMEERRIETLTFAALIVLFAVAILYQNRLKAEWISLIGGTILLGSAIYQSQRRWRVNPTTWIGGSIMLIAGIFALNGTALPLGVYLPMVVFGGVIVVSFLTGEI
jgi:hypothetical protein